MKMTEKQKQDEQTKVSCRENRVMDCLQKHEDTKCLMRAPSVVDIRKALSLSSHGFLLLATDRIGPPKTASRACFDLSIDVLLRSQKIDETNNDVTDRIEDAWNYLRAIEAFA